MKCRKIYGRIEDGLLQWSAAFYRAWSHLLEVQVFWLGTKKENEFIIIIFW